MIVFDIFNEITKVPRPSKHEEQIEAWLIEFAKQHGIEYQQDKAGNVVMRVPATAGYENHPMVILQAHMDMVCEKNSDVEHDFLHDPIQTYTDGDWLKAKGTTLGGDDGIGMSMALAVMISKDIAHPALECLFTIDEETGLTGAFHLGADMLHGSRLINLDSEDDGQIFIGCAGGIDTLVRVPYQRIQTNDQGPLFAAQIRISGLLGGHSGDDINKGRANANKVLVRFLFMLQHEMGGMFPLIENIEGGNLRNAIAREASATICVPMNQKENLRILLNQYIAEIESEYEQVEEQMQIELDSCDVPQTVLEPKLATSLIRALYACPHGMIAMSKDMPGLVETSTNLASVKMHDDYIEINTSQRSSVESKKHDIKNQVECALQQISPDTIVTHGDGYPGWNPNIHSELLTITDQAYTTISGEKAQVLAIHAGLECGLFLEKYPHLDMVSVGPQMMGVHSPSEQLSISSTEKTWKWLCEILRNC